MKPANGGPALSILIYHRVLARPDALFPDIPDAARFARQLGLLKRFFRVMPLLEAARRLQDGSLPPRAACITFDDGYADNAQVALPLLRRHGLSACFFVASGYLDGGRMWNDAIVDRLRHAPGAELDLSEWGLGRLALGTLALRRQAIGTVLGALKYLPFEQRQTLSAQLSRGAPAVAPPMMSSAELVALHRAGMEIGAHTVGHPILSTLSERAAHDEIAHGKRALEAIIDAPVSLFAYPNGVPRQDFGPSHVAMVRALGFAAAVTTAWGAGRPGDDLFQLPRFTPWDRGRLRFLLRMRQNLALERDR
ncbi:MAG: polysaccharide deacetylase family protein [Pseudomonadota bacterium]